MLLLSLSLCLSFSFALQAIVQPNEKECFFFEYEEYHRDVVLDFQVVDDTTAALTWTLSGPMIENEKAIILDEMKEKAGRWVKVLEAGLYEFCFAHVYETPTTMALVAFSVHANEPHQDVLSHADASTVSM